jgi:membrane protein YqaA with SNARE-associated domain
MSDEAGSPIAQRPPAPATPRTPPARPKSSLRLQLARVGMLVFVVIITLYVYSIRNQTEQLQRYGYPGLFLLSILANATIILPAPGIAFTFGAGALKALSPLWVGIVAGAGATLGELSGYMAGFSGQAVIENRQAYERFERWMKRYGPIAIVGLAFVPNPLFDLAGMMSGALKMPVHHFVFWCALGKIPKMILVAFAGAYSWEWVSRLFH